MVEKEFFFEGGKIYMLKYLIWMIAWIVSQKLMMAAGIIVDASLGSVIFSSVLSVIAVLYAREEKWIMRIACTLIALWCINTIIEGEIINALVGGSLNAILVIMAVKAKSSRGG